MAIQYIRNKHFFYINWKDVISLSYKKLTIKTNALIGQSRSFPKAPTQKTMTSPLSNQFSGDTIEYPAIGKVILDKQIVDTHGKKVVRVNDIILIRTGQILRVTHASIGFRSMVRRLGFEKQIDFIVSALKPESKYLRSEKLISWKYVYALPGRNIHSSVRLKLTNEDIQKIHPADLADILEELDTFERDTIFHQLDPKLQAETLSEVDAETMSHLIKNESSEDMAKIIENMDTEDAADVLAELSDEKQNEIISQIEDLDTKEELQDLLEYDENCAGGLMSPDYLEVRSHALKKDILDIIKNEADEFKTIYTIFIVNELNKLIGTCELKNLLMASDDCPISEIMDSNDLKFLTPDIYWEEVAEFMSKYDLMHVPILEEDHSILGIIAVDDVLPWLLDE